MEAGYEGQQGVSRDDGGGGPPRRRRRRGLIIGALIALALLLLTAATVVLVLLLSAGGETGGGTAVAPETFEEEYVSGEGSDKIAVVPVVGVIGSTDSSGALGTPAATPQVLQDQLHQAADDESVKAVILEVNSPGGGVTASDAMHDAILDFKRQARKPVVVSMGDTAASGGYYISTAADRIVANETTLTGSLGVIFSWLNYGEAARKLGLEEEVFKSGKFKDIGSPTREPTKEEAEIFRGLIDEAYGDFVRVISEGRGIPRDRVREIADGRVYSGQQARALNLVDELGGLDRAADVARRLSKTREATVVRYTQDPGFAGLLSARLADDEPQAAKILEEAGLSKTPKLQYLYRP
jgi:protease-4